MLLALFFCYIFFLIYTWCIQSHIFKVHTWHLCNLSCFSLWPELNRIFDTIILNFNSFSSNRSNEDAIINICFCILVWSEDSWLQEHAGKTLEKSTEEVEEDKGTKRPAEDTNLVNYCLCPGQTLFKTLFFMVSIA